jgi:L-threonylcarbamoyladenylate synthase
MTKSTTLRFPSTVDISAAARTIRRGGVVAFPTETIYGLGANAFDDAACKKIYVLKGRPSDNPLIVHISDEAMLRSVVARIPAAARPLMNRFWPGPLTIIFPKGSRVAPTVSRLATVAVRMPNHPVALALIDAAGVPIAAPSANKSGSPSPTTAQHVRDDFRNASNLIILDGDDTKTPATTRMTSRHGIESTVVAVDGTPRVLRLGAITLEQLQSVVPDIRIATHKQQPEATPESPGMKYQHYAPKQPLHLFGPRQIAALKRCAKDTANCPDPVILCKDRFAKELARYSRHPIVSLGRTDDDVARNLFSALRTPHGKTLLVLGVARRGIGRSVMDRLERAATHSRF